MKRRTALVGSLAALTAATSAKAADLPVDLQLVLAVDVSRSIDEVEAELQRRGYIEALTNERVIDAILSGENKRIALCYTEWAGTHYQMVVIDWTVIDSAAAARRFAEKLAEAPRTSQSWTAVGAARKLDELGIDPNEVEILVIDRNPYHNIRVRNYEVDLGDVVIPLEEVFMPIGVRHLTASPSFGN